MSEGFDEEESNMDSSSTTESQTSCRDQQSSASEQSIARSETRRVNRSKWLVAMVMLFAAAGVGTATYFFIRNEEQESFENEYYDIATEVADLAHHEASNVFQAVESLSTTITSFSHSSSAFPNVSLPHFEVRGQQNNRLSKALQVTFAPIIKTSNKKEWESYSVDNQGWTKEAFKYSREPHDPEDIMTISERVWRFSDSVSGDAVVQNGEGVSFGPGNFAPVWQQSPAPHDTSIINFDLLSHPTFARIYHGMWETGKPVLSEVTDISFLYQGAIKDGPEHPHSFLLDPIYSAFRSENPGPGSLLGFLVAVIGWDAYFANILPQGVDGIDVVMESACGNHFTYKINGSEAVFVGHGDLHDQNYDHLVLQTPFAPFLKYEFSETHEHCEYGLNIYPSWELESHYMTNKPFLYTIAVIAVFFFTAFVFALYDHFVNVRQAKVMATAKRTNAIVSSLFPSNVRDRLLEDAQRQAEDDVKGKTIFSFNTTPKNQLRDFLDVENGEARVSPHGSKPIADLFPDATVMFGDIVGFTAWSSVREPSQVFILLETLYHAFDEIAKIRKVFKVETVGDCYVAVAGLPDPRNDHAVVMARFARDCLTKMNGLTKKLEVTLGPDTGDLSMRIGLHSGPVTAGVLRGDKSRFQLFGDTVNTAARMESSGERNRIHLSAETAHLLGAAGKSHWTKPRQDIVTAKGKGEMSTFWMEVKVPSGPSCRSGSSYVSDEPHDEKGELEAKKWTSVGLGPNQDAGAVNSMLLDSKVRRLVQWNTDVLARLLRQIVSRREAARECGHATNLMQATTSAPRIQPQPGKMVLDEVKEIIRLPAFDPEAAGCQQDPETIEIDPVALAQLEDYVAMIAAMYRNNPFHNFEHASHVGMSVSKLLSRIVAPDLQISADGVASTLHDYTFGITSDPLTQFACVFAAVIHDVDHQGIPNAQLVNEQAAIASVYKGKSVAEQNSVDIAWSLLMDSKFAQLRAVICCDETEMCHFREIVVNSVMATDIVDKELKILRNQRWDTAFSKDPADQDSRDNVNRKATIVIEHLIQASDIAHTMQHWHIYRKWNERLFHEMYDAYRKGRAEKDPSEFWYTGEIGFFDFYIIPLAKKLESCGVFGVSSDEYLNYAQKNRSEWESKGKEVVATMVEKYNSQYSTTQGIRLDGIQEDEKSPLRSWLFRSDDSFSNDEPLKVFETDDRVGD